MKKLLFRKKERKKIEKNFPNNQEEAKECQPLETTSTGDLRTLGKNVWPISNGVFRNMSPGCQLLPASSRSNC